MVSPWAVLLCLVLPHAEEESSEGTELEDEVDSEAGSEEEEEEEEGDDELEDSPVAGKRKRPPSKVQCGVVCSTT